MDFNESRIDRTAFQVFTSFEEADEADRRYWWSRTPEERLQHMQHLRELNYGDEASARLQRVLEITRRIPG
ncbi:MAG: hypothetical protein IIB09_00165 [Bacteroidetes bacterium]|nr:hypothetical protein [Bacteroidota bacterium]